MTILAETTAQVLVSETITLPLAAVKIDEIVASVPEMTCFVIANKVIFQGILHKQIFFVDENGIVRHLGVDIPFSGFVDLPGVTAGLACQLTPTVVFVGFELLTPTQLRENVIIDVEVAVTNMPTNTFVVTQTLPQTPQRFRLPNTASVRGPNGGIPV
ncbi:MAG: DUF3794 domain-containing protein, partial [Bacillota bacterium]